MTEWDSARSFNLDAENGDRVCLCYVSSTSDTVQQVVGEVTGYGGMTEFTKVTQDGTGDAYLMCGVGFIKCECGEIRRDGCKVGNFVSAREVNSHD